MKYCVMALTMRNFLIKLHKKQQYEIQFFVYDPDTNKLPKKTFEKIL